MLALVEKLKLNSVAIVGWSDGGIIGLDLAMNHPALVKKLVMIGSNFRADGMTAESIAEAENLTPDDPLLEDARFFYRTHRAEPGQLARTLRQGEDHVADAAQLHGCRPGEDPGEDARHPGRA